jgi:serine/threonine-protein kinase
VTEATDILAGPGSKPPNPRPEEDPRSTGMHAVPTAGDRLGGKYLVDRLLGSGGMGLVLAAKNLETGEQVAIKLLRPKAAGDKIHAERFAREARAIVKIKSDHVVKVFDAGTLSESDAPFIVMEYLSGRDLSQMIREEGAMPLQAAADLMLQVCDAVASAHAVGVVHRDLKPSNFFVTQDPVTGRPRVKVLDFGIAKAIGQDGVVDPNLTETQAVFGSPTYMSPEQIRSAKHVDHRSDIWSLGVALYEVTTGRLPFAADNVAGLLASIVADPPYYPRGFVPDMPHVFEELLLACLHKDPKQRVQSAGDLGKALAPFATQGPATDALLASIIRSSPPTNQPFPGETGPRMPQLSYPSVQSTGPVQMQMPSAPTTGPVGPESSSKWPGLPPDGQRTSGVAFGSTGSDLHATMPKPIGRKVATGVGVVVLLGAIGGGAFFGPRFLKKPAPPAPAAVQPSAAPPPTVSETAPAPPPIASTPAPPVTASAEASAKPPTPKKPPRAHPAPAPRPAPAPGKPAVDPTGDRF